MRNRAKHGQTWVLLVSLALLLVAAGGCRSAVDDFYTPLTKPRCGTGGAAGVGGDTSSGGGGADCTTGGGETN